VSVTWSAPHADPENVGGVKHPPQKTTRAFMVRASCLFCILLIRTTTLMNEFLLLQELRLELKHSHCTTDHRRELMKEDSDAVMK
jgi:hypothetical protein